MPRIRKAIAGVDPQLLTPRDTWGDAAAYDAEAARLVALFTRNFQRFEAEVDAKVKAAAPRLAA